MRLVLLLALAGCTSPTHPPDLTGAYVLFFCGVNCPLNVFVTDEGRITDSIAQEQPHIAEEVVRAAR